MPLVAEPIYWNLVQTLGWIYLSDSKWVDRAGDTGLPESERPSVCCLAMLEPNIRRRYTSITEAKTELIYGLQSGEIQVFGILNGRGDSAPIPPVYWAAAELAFAPEAAYPSPLYRLGASTWTDLKLLRTEIIEYWPPMGANTFPAEPALQALKIAEIWIQETPVGGLTVRRQAIWLLEFFSWVDPRRSRA